MAAGRDEPCCDGRAESPGCEGPGGCVTVTVPHSRHTDDETFGTTSSGDVVTFCVAVSLSYCKQILVV